MMLRRMLLATALLAATCRGGPERDQDRPDTLPAGGTQGQALPRLELPPPGRLYHGVYPGDFKVWEDEITSGTLRAYEAAAGWRAAWVYFSNDWGDGIDFPTGTAEWIKDQGKIPYIRMTPRSHDEISYLTCEPDSHAPKYSMAKIVDGVYDDSLGRWMRAARELDWPILVEFGTEMNGCTFPWTGKWNGRDSTRYGDPDLHDGPERFRDAFRHVVQMARDSGATNITWVFHVDSEDDPDSLWNRFENYYPGPECVDLLAVSVYGPETKGSDNPFAPELDAVRRRFFRMDRTRPMIVAEFGAPREIGENRQAAWAAEAVRHLLSIQPSDGNRVVGFAWWNSAWAEPHDLPEPTTDMRVWRSKPLRDSLRVVLADPRVLHQPAHERQAVQPVRCEPLRRP